MSKVSNTFNNYFPADYQKASVPIQLQILCSLLTDGCDLQIKGLTQSSKTIAQLVTHSPSVTSLRRPVKERETPVPVMLVWNCMHLFAQKLLFSVSFLLDCPFHMIGVSQSATISVWICWKSTILKVHLLLPLKHLPLLQRIMLTSMLHQVRWRNTLMELVWQPCSFHRRKSGYEKISNIQYESSW